MLHLQKYSFYQNKMLTKNIEFIICRLFVLNINSNNLRKIKIFKQSLCISFDMYKENKATHA